MKIIAICTSFVLLVGAVLVFSQNIPQNEIRKDSSLFVGVLICACYSRGYNDINTGELSIITPENLNNPQFFLFVDNQKMKIDIKLFSRFLSLYTMGCIDALNEREDKGQKTVRALATAFPNLKPKIIFLYEEILGGNRILTYEENPLYEDREEI